MANVAHFIGTQVDRPVLDATGLKGHYALTLSWFKDTARRVTAASQAPGAETIDPLPGPTIYEAIESQLGLKLQPKNGMVEMVVVDRAEKTPIAN
jgi:uncharacterized protein (TIGR03435 family)